MFGTSPKTTAAGIAALITLTLSVLASFGLELKGVTDEQILAVGALLASLFQGIGLMVSRDNKTSDQKAGVRPETPKFGVTTGRGGHIHVYPCLILGIFFTVLLTLGCATTAKTSFVDTDGTGFDAVSKAGIGGTLDTTNQNMTYIIGQDGSVEIRVGQDAKGLDNTLQAEMLIGAIEASGTAIREGVAGIVSDLITNGMIGPLGGGEVVPGEGGLLNRVVLAQEKIEKLCTILCRFNLVEDSTLCQCNNPQQ